MSTTDQETSGTEAPDGERPFRVRDVFQLRRPAEREDREEPPAAVAPQAAQVPPMPTEPPAIPAPPVGRAARADNHHVPDWWSTDKDITPAAPANQSCQHPNPYSFRLDGQVIPYWCPDCKTELAEDFLDANPKPEPARPGGKPCQHPDPHEVRSKVTRRLLAFWCADCETQLEIPDDYDELDDVTETDTDDGGGQAGSGGGPVDKVPAVIRKRWEQLRGNGGTSYSRPAYPAAVASPKKSLIDAWTGMSAKSKHLLYNGAALGVGFWIGVPQFFTAEVAYLDATYDSWTALPVIPWYCIAVAIWVLDHRTRRWFPPFAILTRVPLVSMIVGALLYGTPAA